MPPNLPTSVNVRKLPKQVQEADATVGPSNLGQRLLCDASSSEVCIGILSSPRRFFFYCIAELAMKPCRSSRSNTRGGFEKTL